MKSIPFLICLAFAAILTVALLQPVEVDAVYTTKVYREADKLVATTGGLIDCATDTLKVQGRTLLLSQYSSVPSATAVTATVSGLDADDYLSATLNTAAEIYLLSAEPTVGYATLTFNATSASTVKVTLMSWQD